MSLPVYAVDAGMHGAKFSHGYVKLVADHHLRTDTSADLDRFAGVTGPYLDRESL